MAGEGAAEVDDRRSMRFGLVFAPGAGDVEAIVADTGAEGGAA